MRKRDAFLPAVAFLASLLLAGCWGATKTTAPENAPPIAAPAPTGNLNAGIVGVDVPADGKPVVTFTLYDENGAALEPSVLAALAASRQGGIRFYLARIADNGYYENYCKSSTGLPGYDNVSASRFASLGGGRFTYTFSTSIDNASQTLGGITLAGKEGLTHTLAIQAYRNILTATGKTFQQAANPYFNFRPDGAAVTATREIVAVSNCNGCHGKLAIHGGSRREIALCILCHYPGVNDPATGNSVGLMSLVHKIHYGAKLPSNVAGGNYYVGRSSFKTVGYPFMSTDSKANLTPIKCVKCHSAGKDAAGRDFGRDAARYKSNPTYSKCTSCHDTMKYDGVKSIVVKDNTTPVTVTNDNVILHNLLNGGSLIDVSGVQADNTAKCTPCHSQPQFAGTQYNYGDVQSMHTVIEESSYNFGVNFRILAVDNIGLTNRSPRVTFKVTYDNGDVIVPSDNSSVTSLSMKFGYIPAGSLDFSNNLLTDNGAATRPGQPMTLAITGTSTAVNNLTNNGDGTWTAYLAKVNSAYPATAAGIGVVTLEGRVGMIGSLTTPRKGTLTNSSVRFSGRSAQWFFDLATGAHVTDPTLTRRRVVDTDKCRVCHNIVRLHGGSRINTEECVVCHNSSASYLRASDNTQYSIDLKYLIMRVHTGEKGESTYPWGMEIRYPRDRRDCLACHVDTIPQVPLRTGVPPVSVSRGTIQNDNADDNKIGPTRAACTACHDGAAFPLPHILNQTKGTPSNPVELCAQCHMTGLLFGPDFGHEAVR
ncbi:MAG TPA: OmcA/MtrC family decaheme c-type cytochrome [Candidatus Deferrimicrobiaceae bacterium]